MSYGADSLSLKHLRRAGQERLEVLALPSCSHVLPTKLERVLVECPADRAFCASEVRDIGRGHAGYMVSLHNRGMIECLGYKNKHEKVKRWKLTPAGSELADKLRARGKA